MKKNFNKIDNLLINTVKQYKLESAFYQYQVGKYWNQVVESYVGESAREQTKVMEFKKGVLVVACLNQKLAYQIKVLASRIIYALNNLIGKLAIKTMRVEY